MYYNFTLTVGASTAFGETTDYDAFWDKMTEPAEFHDFELPSGTVHTVLPGIFHLYPMNTPKFWREIRSLKVLPVR